MIAAETSLDGPFDVPESLAQHDLDYRTNYERRMRLASAKVLRAKFRKP
jgi:hypothetical protein